MNLNRFLRFLVRVNPCKKCKKWTTKLILFAARHVSGYLVATDVFGNSFLLDLDNWIDCRIYLEGSYEKPWILALKDCADRHECTHFIDIGANIGVYTLFFASSTNNMRILAFEPDPRNFLQLQTNLFLNNHGAKVEPYEVALSSENANASFYISRDPCDEDEVGKINTGTSSLVQNKERHHDAMLIQTKKLDDLFQFQNQKIAIKMDVEGHELAVLEGMKSILINNDCVIQLETFAKEFDRSNAFLQDLGYQIGQQLDASGFNYIYEKVSQKNNVSSGAHKVRL